MESEIRNKLSLRRMFCANASVLLCRHLKLRLCYLVHVSFFAGLGGIGGDAGN